MSAPEMLVQLTTADLRTLLRTELEQALADRSTPPALLTQDALARELGVSSRTIYELRQRGLPVVMVCDAPRFELAVCLAWLREQRPGAYEKVKGSKAPRRRAA